MKRIIIALLLTIIGLGAYAQSWTPAQYTQAKGLIGDSVLRAPRVDTIWKGGTKDSIGAIVYSPSGKALWLKTDTGWAKVGTGATDLSPYMQYADTSAMLSPYLRIVDTAGLIREIPNLQQVTDAGQETANAISITGDDNAPSPAKGLQLSYNGGARIEAANPSTGDPTSLILSASTVYADDAIIGPLTTTGNAKFTGNGTPGPGKLPTGTDGTGNWLWNGSYWDSTTVKSNVYTKSQADGRFLQSLNGLTATTQTFSTGTTGTNFNISSSGSTHTFNIPTASASNRGLLSPTDWAVFNSKLGSVPTLDQVLLAGNTSTQIANPAKLFLGPGSDPSASLIVNTPGFIVLKDSKYAFGVRDHKWLRMNDTSQLIQDSIRWSSDIFGKPSTLSGYGITDANLSTVLSNGNTANNNISIGNISNSTFYGYSSNRLIGSSGITGRLGVSSAGGSNGGVSITTDDGTNIRVLYLINSDTYPRYSPDNGASRYPILVSSSTSSVIASVGGIVNTGTSSLSGAVSINESSPNAQIDIRGTSSSTGTALRVRNSTPSTVFQVDNNGDITLFNGIKILTGSGSPNSVVTAPAGSMYLNTAGGAGTTLYIKESGTGNTGWVAK